MTAAQAHPIPPARSIHGWFRDLSAWQPQQLWFGHLLLHHIEALVSVSHAHPLETFQLALLRIIALSAARADGTISLEHLQLDRQLLSQVLRALREQGLLQSNNAGWELTAAGRHTATTGEFTQLGQERRGFHFVDNRASNRPAHFLTLALPAQPYLTPGADYFFDPRWLTSCLQQSPEWKRRHRFPTDVEAILGADASVPATTGTLSWRQVILDRPEQLTAVLIQTRDPATGTAIHGFGVKTEDWKLRSDKPILSLRAGWEAVLPELTEEPSPDAWRASWQSWCRQRNLPPTETDACGLHYAGLQLEVRVSKRLMERMKAGRLEVLHGETWLLAGQGRTRSGAWVKIVEEHELPPPKELPP